MSEWAIAPVYGALLCPGQEVLYLNSSGSQPWLHSRITWADFFFFFFTNTYASLPKMLIELIQVWLGHGEVLQTSQVMLITAPEFFTTTPLLLFPIYR